MFRSVIQIHITNSANKQELLTPSQQGSRKPLKWKETNDFDLFECIDEG